MTSIATQMQAWAARTSRAPTDTRRLWIAYAPTPASRTPGNPPSHSPANGGEGLSEAEGVARGDEEDEPRRAGETDDHREDGDRRGRDGEHRPEPPHPEEAEGGHLAPARGGARGRVPIRAAPPVEDLVDRVGLPALHEGRQIGRAHV